MSDSKPTPPELRLYDSLRRHKVDFEPVTAGKVSMYLCGPTTYDDAHIGHAYSAICFDIIRRSLGWLGFQVCFVRNITDVDDKIIKRANERGEDWNELASRFADAYNRDMAAMGLAAPDIEPRVSTHIAEVVALTTLLVEAGKAYPIGGDVYYSVESFADYGKLSGQSIDDLRSGARVEVDQRKRSPLDFALWKAAKPDEPAWDSPWGKGRPGWHIECSAMTGKHLGETFDIHAGGKDLIFPHHENEIAQSQGAHGAGTFARYWLHNGFLNFSGEKMSKSIGNVFGCQQIVAAVGGEAMRLFTASHHYRSPVNFEVVTEEGSPRFKDLEAVDRRLDYFYTTLKRLDDFLAVGKEPGDGPVVSEAERLVPAAHEGLCDDFNAPVVIAALGEAARMANKLLDEPKGVAKDVRRRSLRRLSADIRDVAQGALGLLVQSPSAFLADRRQRLASRRGIDAARIGELLADRTQARKSKDFARADELRELIHEMGVEVLDTPAGADWKVIE
jgi:cysteinyl-tRNA synthetase